jgi:type I restriction-modification system DNA methylase subunit
MNSKKKLGQFYTTNYEYILEGFDIPSGSKVIEPFVGQGDLLKWVGPRYSVEAYDIDPKIDAITRDTLANPPDYEGKFVITNPPYLAKNKNKDKTIYDKYAVDDLYKAFLKSLVEGNVQGGIVIVPLNFISDRDKKIRNTFFQNYNITKMKIFEETVFRDTSYTVCAFQFSKGKQTSTFPATILPSSKKIDLSLEEKWGWRVGGHLHEKKNSKYKIGRLLPGHIPSSDLFLYAIDTGTNDGRIRLAVKKEHFYGKNTDRAFATITTDIPIKDEQLVAKKFNEQLESYRSQYHSLFLTNYRNSTKSYARKRISFDMCYNMIKEILEKLD